MPRPESKILASCFAIVLVITYALILTVERVNFWSILGLYGVAGGLTYLLYKQNLSVKYILYIGLACRLVAFFCEPNLSDDFYRFLWDGALSNEGVHPFFYTPREVVQRQLLPDEFVQLFPLLNSQDYYTVYPTVIQLVDYFSVLLGRTFNGSWLVMKVFFVVAELLSFYFLYHLVSPNKRAHLFFYWLCPLVVIEFVGNLHFECLMLTFLLGAIYFSKKEKAWLTGLFLVLAVYTKFVPLVFVPFFFFHLAAHKRLTFVLSFGVFLVVGFAPFYSIEALSGLWSSIQLYFGSFEFNSCFMYFKNDYPKVSVVVKLFGLGFLAFWMIRSIWKRYELGYSIGVFYGVYLLFSQSIHPWYMLPLVALFVNNTKLRSLALLWSGLIFLTYITYVVQPYQQQWWVNAVEYGLLVIYGGFIYVSSGKAKANYIRVVNAFVKK